jgi:Holliday junction resolvase
MGMMSKNKGKVGEREVSELIRSYGFEARRGQQFAGGTDSPDVVHSIPNCHVEVKRTEALQLWPALAQANADKRPGEMATVWHRKNGKPWIVILDAKEFLILLGGKRTDG